MATHQASAPLARQGGRSSQDRHNIRDPSISSRASSVTSTLTCLVLSSTTTRSAAGTLSQQLRVKACVCTTFAVVFMSLVVSPRLVGRVLREETVAHGVSVCVKFTGSAQYVGSINILKSFFSNEYAYLLGTFVDHYKKCCGHLKLATAGEGMCVHYFRRGVHVSHCVPTVSRSCSARRNPCAWRHCM